MTLAALIAACAKLGSFKFAPLLGAAGVFAAAGAAGAADLKVLGSPGTRAPYTLLVPGFEAASGHKVATAWDTVVRLTKRVADGETADVIMLPSAQIDELTTLGRLVAGTKVNVATSGVGVAVRAGAPKVDVSSAEGIRRALTDGRTIAFSTGPSGVHIQRLIAGWGLTEQLKGKIVPPVPNVPIGEIVARGDAGIGFQQVSELLPVKGIDYLGPLPPEIQETTVFSAAVHTAAGNVEAARALLKYLTAPEAAPVIRGTGMEPGT
jgi:molybdate transport system substrate-binding protein